MTVLLAGASQTHLGTAMPSGGGHIITAGQRQRVAIGRAIVREPKVFLFDEPLSSLDAELRVQTRIDVARLHKALGMATMIYVTHDQTEAMTLADRIVVLRAGRIEQVGRPTDFSDDPDNALVAGFIGRPRMNLLAATATGPREIDVAGHRIGVPGLATGLVDGQSLQFGIRPEHLTGPGGGTVDMRIDVVEQLGGTAFVHAEIAPGVPVVIETRDRRPVAGEGITATIDSARVNLFDAEGQRVR